MLVKINKILSVFLVLCLYSSVTFSQIANEIEKVYLKFDTTQIIPPLLLGITYKEGMYGKFDKEKQIKFGRINKEPDIVDSFIFDKQKGQMRCLTKQELSTLPIAEFKHLEEVAKNKGHRDNPGKVFTRIALVEITKDGKIILYDPVKWKRVVYIE